MKHTYRQAIQLQIAGMEKMYDIAGALRDTAIHLKVIYNQLKNKKV